MNIVAMKSIRIGAGLGFYGDAWEPIAASIERGGVLAVQAAEGNPVPFPKVA